MSKLYSRHKKAIGIVILIVAIAFFVFWEFVGRKQFLYQEVVVLKDDVLKGTQITLDMLSIQKTEIENIVSKPVINASDIVGLEAKHFIPANMQLVSNFFDIPALVLNDEEKIMKIPGDWLHSFPETIRRKDEIYIYAVKVDENKNSIIKNSKDDKLYVFKTVVAYVKDNANREVQSLDTERLVGSSVVSEIEIIITESNFRELEKYINAGYEFALMYQ
ncbi:hypothetical protein JYG23_09475 [Sedimentibacter sp. zth1]|uniref:hypothetical protein n=1 Tax=Sedimentibacter sp. zth1 TaxID=2816908 RepID=UPI001A91BF03|nr:hypothetical protein [Sedimentibacter sp. zth1]QSX04921.1 hypothetical protein JYG23_09475 [Sedimentibacter sp. zth1]